MKSKLTRKGVNAVPVLEEDGAITGIISSSDLTACTNDTSSVQDIMSTHVHIALKNNQVKDAANIMVKNGVHHLVIMEEGNVVGMVSSMDIVKVFAGS